MPSQILLKTNTSTSAREKMDDGFLKIACKKIKSSIQWRLVRILTKHYPLHIRPRDVNTNNSTYAVRSSNTLYYD